MNPEGTLRCLNRLNEEKKLLDIRYDEKEERNDNDSLMELVNRSAKAQSNSRISHRAALLFLNTYSV